jgi:hypothetical protein
MTGGLSTLRMVSGKYYMEATVDSISSAGLVLGIMGSDRYTATNEFTGKRFDAYGYYSIDGKLFNDYDSNSTSFTFGDSYTTSDVIGIAVDLDNDKLYFSKNGTFQNSANPSAGTGGQSIISAKSTTAGFYRFCLTDGGTGSTDIVTANFGQKSFTHTPPTGFSALQQDNLPTTDKGISGFVWTKNRDTSRSPTLYDSNRGRHIAMFPSGNDGNTTYVNGLQKFLAGGQAIGEQVHENEASYSFVSWNWVCNGGTTETNTDGNTTVTLQKNTDAGFSMGTFTSTVAAQTCGHGLGVTPEWIILKRTDGTQNWMVYHKQIDLTDAHYLHLNNTDAEQTGSDFGNTLPTSTVFTTNVTGTAGRTYIFYAWNSVEGYSKFGKYSGNGSTNGPFIYTGFKPAWLMIKRTDSSTGGNWSIIDNRRSTFNPVGKPLLADNTGAESGLSDITMDLLSNGFKIRNTLNSNNNSSGTYVYMAFAEHPFVGDGTSPVTAR